MATSSTKATILLVQGSFQRPEVYGKLVKALEVQGYSVVQPPLPSLTNPERPDFGSTTLVDDASAVQLEVQRLVEQEGRYVLVAMHSYGGLVGSEATSEELSVAKRKEQGLAGGVVHLFYFAAFILAQGQSVLGVYGESPNNNVTPDGHMSFQNAAQKLYGDLPPEEARYWASKVIDQSYAVQTTELSRAAYRYIPSTYLVCQNDQAVPPEFQEMFAKTANADIQNIKSSHSPMLSCTDELVERITTSAVEAMGRMA